MRVACFCGVDFDAERLDDRCPQCDLALCDEKPVMRSLSHALTNEAWRDFAAEGLTYGVMKDGTGTVWAKDAPNGFIGVGSSVGQAWDDLEERRRDRVTA